MGLKKKKKIVVFHILDILTRYTDEQHPMNYPAIMEKLSSIYDERPDIKTVASNIGTLMDAGYQIVKCGNYGVFLAERDFEDGELMYLVDAVNSSNSIPARQVRELIEKLTKSCSKYQKTKYKATNKIDVVSKSKNKEMFYIIEVLNEAIEKGKKVSFCYNEYKVSKEQTPRFKGKEFKINPYFLVNSRGKYYLVCNYDKYNNLSNYKIDCISNIKLLDEPIKPMKELDDMEGFSKDKYIKEHIYMTFGNSVSATLKLDEAKYLGDIIDWFGDSVSVSENKDNTLCVKLNVNEQALIYWAMQYGKHIEVISPKETREKIKTTLKDILKRYEV